jgi:hypothetical protein
MCEHIKYFNENYLEKFKTHVKIVADKTNAFRNDNKLITHDDIDLRKIELFMNKIACIYSFTSDFDKVENCPFDNEHYICYKYYQLSKHKMSILFQQIILEIILFDGKIVENETGIIQKYDCTTSGMYNFSRVEQIPSFGGNIFEMKKYGDFKYLKYSKLRQNNFSFLWFHHCNDPVTYILLLPLVFSYYFSICPT